MPTGMRRTINTALHVYFVVVQYGTVIFCFDSRGEIEDVSYLYNGI